MKLTNRILWITFLILNTSNASQAQFSWAIQEGSTGVDVGKGVKTNQQGEIVIYGDVAGDPLFNNLTRKGGGLADGFVAKYTNTGKLLWVRLIGGKFVDRVLAGDIDIQGNILIAGTFEDSIHIDNFNIKSKGRKDIFVAKLNTSGTLLWLKSFGSNIDESPNAIVATNGDRFFLSGSFTSSLNLGGKTISSSSIYPSSFIAQFDQSGNTIWCKSATTNSTNAINTLAKMPEGGIAFAGYFSSRFQFDSISTIAPTPDYQIMYGVLDSMGNAMWLKSGGGAYEDVANAMATDANGNMALCGYTAGVAVFDSITIGNSGYNDAFIAFFDKNGKCQWANHGEGLDLDIAYGIAMDNFSHVYSTGFYENSIAFDGNRIYGQDRNIFVVSYTKNGAFRWLKNAGNSGTDCGLAITTDNNNDIILTGYYLYKAQFDNILLPLGNAEDIFVAKLAQPTVAVADIETIKIDVYPNPTNDLIQIEMDKNIDFSITITNTLGQEVMKETNVSKLHLSHLPNGIYHLRVRIKDTNLYHKITLHQP